MPQDRLNLTPTEVLEGAKLVLDFLEQQYPEQVFNNRHEVLMQAAYALTGADGVLLCVGGAR